ncbi:serine protease inhibitor dipetalogastin-like [Ostrinia furnacalis]|uniref:serine protease inhibitor dipetalogastin-like n=1 Tax=Ostrinia furnacalis TaxID=93504 RepID=UPI001038C216|nr:serine protease inhibitor dipetalogastin-like [Ostrinia furnacalis]
MVIREAVIFLAVALTCATAQSPCACPKNRRPVCGSDGISYSNICTFRCEQASDSRLTLRHEGECNSRIKRSIQNQLRCPCTRELRYVCGSDGQTYHNPCLLKCAAKTNPHLKKLHDGVCKENKIIKRSIQNQTQLGCPCTRELRYVCGSDGQTYHNPCLLKCAAKTNPHLKKLHDGMCKDNKIIKRSIQNQNQLGCPCTRELRYVCGSDGQTYHNPCLLKCAAIANPHLKKLHDGVCKENKKIKRSIQNQSKLGCPCTRELRYVCGSDGQTYHNPCLLKCAAKTNPHLKKLHDGVCKKNKIIKRSIQNQTQLGCPCTRELRYVCGSDGQTYHNPCLLKCAAKTNPHLKKLHEGKCKQNTRLKRSIQNQQSCPCTKEIRQVCGNDGRTYNNPCLLECAAKTNPNLEKLSDGACVSKLFNFLQPLCTCTYQIEYVCGTDGVTYDNPCLLKCAALTNPRLAITYREPCKDS